MEQSTAALNSSEEIKPYRIHVSSKYLELTKKKLELTRLPHEALLPKAREWEFGTPKGVVEPLIDFWLEHYTWRSREETLNALPQFRTAISPEPSLGSESSPLPPLRIHFIHLKSPHPHAVPLLLLPSFPLTNLSLSTSPLFAQLTNPEHPTSTQAFHIVCPSIPGLGFSDAFADPSSSSSQLEQTAYIFNTLMQRVGYTHYLASATGSGRESPAGIDYHLIRILGEKYKDNCLGIHVIEPCISAPTARKEPFAWMKFSLAKFFHANIWGYEQDDWTALRATTTTRTNATRNSSRNAEQSPLLKLGAGIGYGAITLLGLREPTTFSYALCDSPIGLLSLICSALKKASPEHKLTETQIIDITQLAWLPGPEAGMRFWSSAVRELSLSRNQTRDVSGRRGGQARMAITTFNSDGVDVENNYVCPAWISSSHQLVFAQRVPGKAGLAVWERSDVLLAGIRGLARVIDVLDSRIRISALEEVVVPLEAPVVGEEVGGEAVVEQEDARGMQMDVESPDTIVAVDMS